MSQIALSNQILRGVVGSTSYGAHIEGQDDRDEMGVFIEPKIAVLGLTPIDHYIQRDQPDGVRSQPGDLDLTLYSLRKFVRLAAAGNPSVIVLLWLQQYELKTELGDRLIGMGQEFISRESGKRFLGYLQAQRKRLTGERTRNVSRPELVEKYGFDTKFAMHALRLGYQGIELLMEGTLTLPMPPKELSILRNVRQGYFKYGEVLQLIEDAENRLIAIVEKATRKVDYEKVNQFLVEMHEDYWNE